MLCDLSALVQYSQSHVLPFHNLSEIKGKGHLKIYIRHNPTSTFRTIGIEDVSACRGDLTCGGLQRFAAPHVSRMLCSFRRALHKMCFWSSKAELRQRVPLHRIYVKQEGKRTIYATIFTDFSC
jgi:hypothetical protein